ncbi:MAG: nucleotidyltransferase domain-containing protein [Chloroflexi bacterium]|nr:nucleotidyltransferase domain-containing protein [Chloroflexota bacterium]
MARVERLGPLFEREGVRLAYLHGSLAREGSGHDVDLAVLAGDADLGCLRQRISDALETDRLDLTDLGRASPLFRFEVLKTGRLLYRQDADTENTFETMVLRQYRDTAPLRAQQAGILRERTQAWLLRRKQYSTD